VTQPPVQHLLAALGPLAVLEGGVQQQRFLDAGAGRQEPQYQHVAGDELRGIEGIFVPASGRAQVVAVCSDPVVQAIEDALDLLVDKKRPGVGVGGQAGQLFVGEVPKGGQPEDCRRWLPSGRAPPPTNRPDAQLRRPISAAPFSRTMPTSSPRG
jgi:hypothetical protein